MHFPRGRPVLARGFQRRWMSVRPPKESDESALTTRGCTRRKVTPQTLQTLKASGTPITMLTAYDYPTGLACASNPLIDITLVGDSLAQVCLGHTSTTQLTLSAMIHHAQAVARATASAHPLLIADMPFGSYHASADDALANAVQLVREARVEGVKLEGGEELVPLVRRLTQAGIPVMAHVGLLPQRHLATSGYKVQGRDADGARRVLDDALALEDAGAFSVLVEGVPKELGRHVTEKLSVPTIGIGAGPWTSGQVLVWDDVMGTWSGHKAKFVRRFGDLKTHRDVAVENYARAVRERAFPSEDTESYTMDPLELAKLTSQ